MRIILPYVFQQLKQAVLDKAGLTTITPSDCKALSLAIARATKNQISDTTLKRIYGFALSSSLPSYYTLNLLSVYCGHKSWDDFNDQHTRRQSGAQVDETIADTFVDTIRKTTYNTLQALKNKSVIPYNLTIERSFAKEHLDLFISGGHKATVLASPAGYGKTVALCHWVENLLNDNLIGKSDIQVLFLNGKIMAGMSPNITVFDWLLALMGFPAGRNLEFLAGRSALGPESFYLIIDEFDTTVYKEEQLDLLFNILLDLLSISKDFPQFKVILTMRSASWMPIYKRLHIENRLQDWFLGFVNENFSEKNVPLFTSYEIRELCNRINPSVTLPVNLHPEVTAFFSYPLFFQYYYQKNYTDLCLSELDHFRIYEVISSYAYDKVYAGKYATEKVLLLRGIMEKGKYINSQFLIYKADVYDLLKTYKDAYYDLINIGYLREMNYSVETKYSEFIEFPNKRLFAANLARKMCYDAGGHNERLCIALSEEVPSYYRIYVLKWCIFNAVKNGEYDLFAHINKVDLPPASKALLLSFISSLIKRNFLNPDQLNDSKNIFDVSNQDVFYYFFGFEFLSADYEQALKDMLRLNLNDKLKLWINICLGLIGLVQLNNQLIEQSLSELKKFPDDAFAGFDINPLYCLEDIYQYLHYGIVNKRALANITAFIFKNHTETSGVDHLNSNNVVHLLAISALGLAGNRKKLLRLIRKFMRSRSETKQCHIYDFFLNIALTYALLDTGDNEAAINIYNKLLDRYRIEQKHYTPYMRICLDYLSIIIQPLISDQPRVRSIIEKILYSNEKSGFVLMEVNILAAYLQLQDFDKVADITESVYLKLKKCIQSIDMHPESYLFNYVFISRYIQA